MAAPDPIAVNDSRTRHCPKLGHELTFAYCRTPGATSPCDRILDCWWEMFDIREFVGAHYGAETLAAPAAPPRNKVTSLLDLIRQAQARTLPPPSVPPL